MMQLFDISSLFYATGGFLIGLAIANWQRKAQQVIVPEKVEAVDVIAVGPPCACAEDGCSCERMATRKRPICMRCRAGSHVYRQVRPEPRVLRQHMHSELCYVSDYGATTYSETHCGYREGEVERR